MPLDHAASVAPLRKHSDVEVRVAGDRLWLRGTHWSDELDRSFRKILGAERYKWLADDQIAPRDCILPNGVLPEGTWSPLDTWLQPVTPPTVLSARVGRQTPLHLVRATGEQAANLLEIDFQAWYDYAVGAPKIRLDRLSFAVSDDGRALIRGEPLPPLPGARYVETKGIAMPLGLTWSPAVDADVLRGSIGLTDGAIALFTADGMCDVLEAEDFVRASRSAVRLTAKELGHVA
jgi:hypothetical protein